MNKIILAPVLFSKLLLICERRSGSLPPPPLHASDHGYPNLPVSNRAHPHPPSARIKTDRNSWSINYFTYNPRGTAAKLPLEYGVAAQLVLLTFLPLNKLTNEIQLQKTLELVAFEGICRITTKYNAYVICYHHVVLF